MPDTVVPYARFLEIRQRGQRVGVELPRQPVATLNGHDYQAVAIDCEVLSNDAYHGTGSALAPSAAQDCLGRDYDPAKAVVRGVRPGAVRDRDPR